MLSNIIQKTPVVPLVQADDPNIAVKQANALLAGGLRIIEVVLRTDSAIACLEAIANEAPDAIVGAGTVLNREQAEEVVRRGAKFIVSPGLDESVVDFCRQNDVTVFPGVVTPSEMMRARNLGLRTVKFFPAGLSGGIPMLKAVSGVFRDMQFMPTGGVSADNLKDYLALPSVVACGGSWLTPKSAVDAGDFDAITTLAKEALTIAREVRN